ncbi:neuronal PAS domain-containing protein 4B [Malaya genurostris]|uniref:neuronal PAS domain-containing protein 4B n=1 Tax=Malaya genurostris TaxID=325434 RepID=UPI0026F3DFB0|nr:neuronal PAS domain-containing protein 4B [Malaya genurostris]
MFTRFDANKSTKGASKLRRDLINSEIANLRDLLPLPQSTRQRLSQLQLMALVCVYVRKANYFQQVFKRSIDIGLHTAPTPNIGFSKAMSGFLMMLTQNGKLLYISDNAAEYLGHSMEDLLIHGDSVYDIIDKQDHGAIQAELGRGVPQHQTSASHHHHSHHGHGASSQLDGEQRIFLCRMNVSRNARRQMRFGDQKVVLVQGHYLSYLPLCSRNEPVFIATCTPIAMPETRECVVQGATNVFTTIHSMDMKVVHIDKNGEFHLGYSRSELQGISWYQLLHWESTREAQSKHRLITQSEQDRSCILLVRMQRRQNDFIWVHVVLQVRDGQDSNQQSVIVCTNQVLSDREASVMLSNSWLYHYYTVQSKMQFGIPFEGATRIPPNTSYYHGHPSPTSTIQAHGYIAPPHHVSYGYHSPVGQTGGGTSGHHMNGSSTPIISHHHGLGGEHYRPYAYCLETQPVDYSSQVQPSMGSIPIRCDSSGSSQSIQPDRNGSPPAKKRALNRIEPLYIPENGHDSPESSVTELHPPTHPGNLEHPDPNHNSSAGIADGGTGSIMGSGGVQTMTLSTSFHNRSTRVLKAPPSSTVTEPTDFIDQWNPSPPWSDTTVQKVPDITHQELSPYMTTTPPTPTSAPHVTGVPSTFSFDWMPEQFVPIMTDCHPPPQSGCVLPCTINQDGIPVPMSLPVPVPIQIPPPPWPSDHRLLALESTSSSSVDRKPTEENHLHHHHLIQQQQLHQQQHQQLQHQLHNPGSSSSSTSTSSSSNPGSSMNSNHQRGVKRSH